MKIYQFKDQHYLPVTQPCIIIAKKRFSLDTSGLAGDVVFYYKGARYDKSGFSFGPGEKWGGTLIKFEPGIIYLCWVGNSHASNGFRRFSVRAA